MLWRETEKSPPFPETMYCHLEQIVYCDDAKTFSQGGKPTIEGAKGHVLSSV